ncbi:MAG: ADP-ribosylation factor-like protein, partial [Candidatus Jordarchaeaceae archaeon]
MIYGLYIFDRTGTDVFHRPYEKLKFDQEFLLQFLRAFTAFIQRVDPSERIECLNFENLKIIYSLSGDMVFTVCTDKNEDEMYVTDKLIKLQREFTLLRNASKAVEEMKEQEKTEETKEQEKILEESSEQEKTEIEAIDEQKKTEEVEDQVVEEVKEQGKVEESSSKVGEDIFEQFKVIADDILFPFFKMVILGQGGVGKTSLLKLIIGETPDSAYIPTIGVDVKEFDFEPKNTRLVFWDFSGQPRYRKLWQPFLEGADVAILVTDSKAESLPETRGILQMIRAEKPDTIIILIANKQDLPDALPPQEIEKQLGLPAHGFIATDPTYREKILQLLKKAISDLIEAKSLQTI